MCEAHEIYQARFMCRSPYTTAERQEGTATTIRLFAVVGSLECLKPYRVVYGAPRYYTCMYQVRYIYKTDESPSVLNIVQNRFSVRTTHQSSQACCWGCDSRFGSRTRTSHRHPPGAGSRAWVILRPFQPPCRLAYCRCAGRR